MISASAEVDLPHVVDNHYIVHCDMTPGTDLDIVRPLCQYVWGSLRFRVCNFQLFRWLKSIISLCLSKLINTFDCHIQNNKNCIILLRHIYWDPWTMTHIGGPYIKMAVWDALTILPLDHDPYWRRIHKDGRVRRLNNPGIYCSCLTVSRNTIDIWNQLINDIALRRYLTDWQPRSNVGLYWLFTYSFNTLFAIYFIKWIETFDC